MVHCLLNRAWNNIGIEATLGAIREEFGAKLNGEVPLGIVSDFFKGFFA